MVYGAQDTTLLISRALYLMLGLCIIHVGYGDGNALHVTHI